MPPKMQWKLEFQQRFAAWRSTRDHSELRWVAYGHLVGV